MRSTTSCTCTRSRPRTGRSRWSRAGSRPLMALGDLTNALLDRMPYARGATSVHSTAAQALAAGQGVCQDHAQVFLAASRLLGVPARYVSGYLHAPEGNSSHAWAEAWLGRR